MKIKLSYSEEFELRSTSNQFITKKLEVNMRVYINGGDWF